MIMLIIINVKNNPVNFRMKKIARTVHDIALAIPQTKQDHPPITPKDESQPKDFQDHPPITPKDGSARVAFPSTGLV